MGDRRGGLLGTMPIPTVTHNPHRHSIVHTLQEITPQLVTVSTSASAGSRGMHASRTHPCSSSTAVYKVRTFPSGSRT